MCLPRIVTLQNGRIFTSVHPNVREYFSECECDLKDGYTEWRKDGRCRIEAELTEGQHIEIAGVKIKLREGCVCTDRTKRVPEQVSLHAKCTTPYVGEKCRLEIYVEKNLIEIFVNDGEYVISNVLYPVLRR